MQRVLIINKKKHVKISIQFLTDLLIDDFQSTVFEMGFQPVCGPGRWVHQEGPQCALQIQGFD